VRVRLQRRRGLRERDRVGPCLAAAPGKGGAARAPHGEHLVVCACAYIASRESLSLACAHGRSAAGAVDHLHVLEVDHLELGGVVGVQHQHLQTLELVRRAAGAGRARPVLAPHQALDQRVVRRGVVAHRASPLAHAGVVLGRLYHVVKVLKFSEHHLNIQKVNLEKIALFLIHFCFRKHKVVDINLKFTTNS
jgi:hypothetical protein